MADSTFQSEVSKARVKLFAVTHFQVEGMDVNLSLVSRMPKEKS